VSQAPPPRDRRVLAVVGLVVVVLLAVSVVSAFVPGMDGALAATPIVVGLLVIGTIVVLARSLRGGAG
jgi:hypothetical protein